MDPVSYDSFRYVACNRWDPTHLEKVDRLLALAPGDKVLEIGSSGGHLLRRLLDRGVDAVGVDANPKAASDRILHMRGDQLDFLDGSFDSVISVHTIEHIPAMTRALSEIVRVLRPWGRALLIYPAEPIRGLYAIPTALLLYGNPLKARQIHCHKVTPTRLRRVMEPLGMEEIHVEFNLMRSPQFVSVFRKTPSW